MVMGMTVSFILIFWRMYTHFYTDQGYLTFTLPAKPSHILLSAGVILLYTLFHWLVFNVLRGTGDVFWRLARYDLPAAGYSFLFTPVFYPIIRSVLKKLRAKYPRHPAPTVL